MKIELTLILKFILWLPLLTISVLAMIISNIVFNISKMLSVFAKMFYADIKNVAKGSKYERLFDFLERYD